MNSTNTHVCRICARDLEGDELKTGLCSSDDCPRHDLIDRVIEQVSNDIEGGDYTALAELLNCVPKANLEAYLPEEGL